MTLKVHALLVLLGVSTCVWGQAVNLTCTKEIIESYGVISYDQAKKERLVFCPHIQYTCCPAYEQFKMFKFYTENVKPAFILLNEVIKKGLDVLSKVVIDTVNSGVIPQKIDGISDKAVKLRLGFLWGKWSRIKPEKIFRTLMKYQKTSSSYVAAWKSAFFCTICDFANHDFIDVEKQRITFSAASCDALVQNTLIFANILNSVLVPYVSTLTEVAARLSGSTKYQKIHNIQRVNKAIADCVADYKQYDSGLGNCKAYCEMFNLATDVFALEGYPEFLANSVIDIKKLGGGAAPAAAGTQAVDQQKPVSRRLIEKSVQELIQQTRERSSRLNQQIENNYYFEAKVPKKFDYDSFNVQRVLAEEAELEVLESRQRDHFKLENRRVLQAVRDWSQDNLDPNNNATAIVDMFHPEFSDPNFGEAAVGKLMEVQDIFNTGDPALFDTLIRKYYKDYYIAELDDIDAPNLFKQMVPDRVDLSEFRTIVSFAGIDMHRIVDKMNWSLAFKQIGVSLTSSSNDDSEMVFPDVIQAINSISDIDVRDFYRNQFFTFRKPHFQLFKETADYLYRNHALSKMRHYIAENMAVYNFLVKSFNQEKANEVWSQIENMRSQVRGLAMNSNATTIGVFNKTVDGKIVECMNVTGPSNSSGYSNVTTICDFKQLQSQYSTVVQLVNPNQLNGYNNYLNDLKNKNRGGANQGGSGSALGQAGSGDNQNQANPTQAGTGSTRKRQKRRALSSRNTKRRLKM